MANLVLSTVAGAVTTIKVPVQGTKSNGEEGVVFFSFKMPLPLSRTEDLIAVLEGTTALPKGVVLPSVIKVSSPAVTGTGGLVFRISRSPTPAELASAIREYCGMTEPAPRKPRKGKDEPVPAAELVNGAAS